MEMWELKLSQKEKTNSSSLSLSVSASGPVASSCAVLWDALGCPRFGVLISTRGATPRWGLARLSRPQGLKTTGWFHFIFSRGGVWKVRRLASISLPPFSITGLAPGPAGVRARSVILTGGCPGHPPALHIPVLEFSILSHFSLKTVSSQLTVWVN